tara:strand:- start:9033 stop:10199 length:1167 start_codon:yes stop_codon:yes gene_type:complete
MKAMTGERIVFDADAHIMEGSNWLSDFADEEVKKSLFTMPVEKLGGKLAEWVKLAESGAHPPENIPELEKNILGGPKGYEALGAFNSEERSRTLDIIGIDAQLVFSTFASLQFAGIRDPDILYRGAAAHNRAMGNWCSNDKRLLGVASIPLRYPDRAAKAAKEAVEMGCSAIGVAPHPAGDLSPGHPDLDPFWRVLEETETPFMLHIGPYHIKPAYMNNGRPRPVDFIGSGEGVMAKDFPNVHHKVEEFLTTICFDGVFERFPGLRGGVIEHGADWVPSFIRRLDYTHRMWAKSTPELKEMKRKPSEQFSEQMRFTPGIWENVSQLISESNDRLYCFSTDYPHVEGGRDPFGKFEATLQDCSAETRTRFYSGNFADMMRSKIPQSAAT